MLDLICDNAPFCVTRDYAPAAETSGMFRKVDTSGRPMAAVPEAVRRLGVRVQYVSSDHLGDIAAQRLRQTCIGAACVVFRMSCQDLTCSWQAAPVAKTGKTQLQEIRLTASSADALARARASVFVSANGVPISLAKLGEGRPALPGLYWGPWTADDTVKRARDRQLPDGPAVPVAPSPP